MKSSHNLLPSRGVQPTSALPTYGPNTVAYRVQNLTQPALLPSNRRPEGFALGLIRYGQIARLHSRGERINYPKALRA